MPGSLREPDAGPAGAGLRIETASAAGLEAVLAMVAACGVGPHWPREAWSGYFRASPDEGLGGLLLLAWGDDGELWGWLAASRVWEQSELECVLVAPARRGRGVAGRLVDGWIAWARGQEVTELALEVRVSNEAALGLYRGKGFVEQGRRRRYYERPVEDAVLMGRGV